MNRTFNEFCGPVYDQAGKLEIPKGKCLTRKGGDQRRSTRCSGS